jgi:hypothetical protein
MEFQHGTHNITELIDTINSIYQEQDVREVDFIPSFEPPFVVCSQNCLGVSMKILKPLYQLAYQETLNICKKIEEIVNQPCNGDRLFTLFESGLKISQVVLTVKGDMPMAYHIRKQAILRKNTLLSGEIKFLTAIFSKHPKSPSGWDHRRWCLNEHMRIHGRNLLASEIETEKELCRISADKYLRNYYAWMHRFWLLQYMNDIQVRNLFNQFISVQR